MRAEGENDRTGKGGMKVLCDAMLGRLARWLRAAGHDTRLAGEAEVDRDILETAIDEGRILLTRDVGFAERKAAKGRLLVLQSEGVEDQARELKRRLAVDWLHAPFSRCVMDNAVLRPARAEEIATLPQDVRDLAGTVTACPICGRLYWAGDHHRHMRDRLETWAKEA